MGSLYVVEISAEVSDLACRLLMRRELRVGDALHLASALCIGRRAGVDCEFIEFDANLNFWADQRRPGSEKSR